MKATNISCVRIMLNFLIKILILILLVVIYCEYLIYYVYLLSCSWPQLSAIEQDFTIRPPTDSTQKPLRVMLLADTHLVSSKNADWFNQHRRDWQIYRSFQSAYFMFEPDLIFLIGDVTHDGDHCSDHEWNRTISRFYSMFDIGSTPKIYVIPGNHDIGSHYSVSENRLRRFEEAFQTPHVRLVTLNEHQVHFVLINSIAFEGDHCRLCSRAERELNEVVGELNRTLAWTRPVLLTHFPLYRRSDAECLTETSSKRESKSKTSVYQAGQDVLSETATHQLLNLIKPRLVFAGHTHQQCYTKHSIKTGKIVSEWTIPSFSWLIRDDPSFLLLSINTNNQRISYCALPRQTTVFWSYIIGAFVVSFYFLFGGHRPLCLIVMSDLFERIMSMAKERGSTKTFCPSEIARKISSNEKEWRSFMEPIRLAAATLIDQGQLVCKQKGEIVDIRTVKGPIRLQIVDR